MPQLSERSVKGLIVEGVAIVLSILLAFAIDAWWDERQERAEEREVLESLYVEFEANRDEAASVILIHDRDIQSVATLMELRQDEILALPAEAAEATISSLANPRTFDAVRGSVDALKKTTDGQPLVTLRDGSENEDNDLIISRRHVADVRRRIKGR